MTVADRQAEKDLTRDRLVSFFIWRLPVVVMVAAGLFPLGQLARGSLWALSLSVLGAGCVTNALRCGRLHCYLTGPFFLVMATASLLHGLGVVSFGPNGWAWLGGLTLVGAILLTVVPERIWGRYARSGVHS